jgi:hypothetical protein
MEETPVVDVNHIQLKVVVTHMRMEPTHLVDVLPILQQVAAMDMEHVQYVQTTALKVVVLHIFIIHAVKVIMYIIIHAVHLILHIHVVQMNIRIILMLAAEDTRITHIRAE